MAFLWFKAFHLIFMVCWFAGLFYLPRLFVYHADATDFISLERFKVMGSRLYYGIMTPSALLTFFCGLGMLHARGIEAYHGQMWLDVKAALLLTLIVYHLFCGRYLKQFRQDVNQHSALFYRWFNEYPALVLVAIIVLTVVRPI
jgi:putative membrane protein